MHRKLTGWERTIAVFADGCCRRFIEPLSSGGFDVIVMDDVGQLHANAGNGLVDLAIVEWPAEEPGLRNVISPLVESCGVIVATGAPRAAGFPDRAVAIQAGADAAISTQFEADELHRTVRAVLRQTRCRRSALRRVQLCVFELRDRVRRFSRRVGGCLRR
ncbi:hypothetical protein VSS74_01515 [Conexibacter stalactiti]|uniref:Response regulatory domain-containing protein n=1 Tax=Conexibacter stalactiti TaxID=1940611 RepID=A0ABU4HI66_9ACTN|nr:hypothetical protein [Conexibacter stalactiti]MDW5592996.1 hypothetical protein [Conexibacter stalactiti]MEC5033637.1 hypothetical protein [Conexibacter stalactiti]